MSDDINKAKRPKTWKCTICGSRYSSYNLLVRHTENMHKDKIPEGMSIHQFLFNERNHKTGQLCVICKKNYTKFNDVSKRYERFCSPECKKKAGEIAERNLKKKTGKGRKERLSDPETQREMLKNKNISGTYVFKDGTKIDYVGSYELDFLKFYEEEFHGNPLDLMECPYSFEYIYEGEKHFYIPDFILTSCNLIIEIKDGAKSNNTNQSIIDTTQKKEKFKDQAVIDSGKFNFIKIRDKEYEDFINVVQLISERNMSGESFTPVIVNPER